MTAYPTDLQLVDQRTLQITWSDGTSGTYSVRQLRDVCPCATCREKRSADETESQTNQLPVISAAEAQPLSIGSMKPVGNYAYSIAFSDGHDTGIFSFEFLRALEADSTES